MLKITPYLGMLVPLVAIGGLWYPLLGYVVAGVFLLGFLISPFLGRWNCGNLCPRGSYHDFWLKKVSVNVKIPRLFKAIWFRALVVGLMMGIMLMRIIATKGAIDKIGMIFVTMCLVTTLLSTILGVIWSPRAWCSFCPMGTIQRGIGGKKKQILCNIHKCTHCRKCTQVCPMQLPVNTITHKPDCIKCGRCIEICPVGALRYSKS